VNPRQIQLLQIDVYSMLAEILGDASGVIIDGGAHNGETASRLARLFPRAEVHAFEPVSSYYHELEQRCAEIGARAHRLALADEPAELVMHVNRNLWTCSLLRANSRAREFHGDWCDTVREETVSTVRLDDWAREHSIGDVALIKLDLQGYELPALRGATELLSRTSAVYSEAQISPEYQGASTFAEIDLFLRDHGFALYQIADLCLKGPHCEPSCCDGLWLRRELLERVRDRAAPRAIELAHDRRSLRMSQALDLCADHGATRVGLYGAGAHSRACGAAIAESPVDVVCFVDDARAGTKLWGLPIVTLDEARRTGLDALVLSSDTVETQLHAKARPLLLAGTAIVTLYQDIVPRWAAPTESR